MTTYIIGGITGSTRLGLRQLAVALQDAGVPNVIGPIPAYDRFSSVRNVALVGYRALHPRRDADAHHFCERILADQTEASGTRGHLNVIALSGGATVAFNTIDLLVSADLHVDHLVTIGGVALRGAPRARAWTRIIGGLDPLALLAPGGATSIFVLRGCQHQDYLGLRQRETMDCLRSVGLVPSSGRSARAEPVHAPFPSPVLTPG